ncbi:MAG TPA: T9SS type A sorting domain-containing protein [Puia sp.]|jgi:hypothetical protein
MKRLLRNFSSIALMLITVSSARAQCTGIVNPSGTGGNSATVGSALWINPNSIGAADGNNATVAALVSLLSIITTTSDYLTFTNLGFSVPPANTICGVTVSVKRSTGALLALGSSAVTDNSIRLFVGGAPAGNDKANTSTSWPTTAAVASYGGNSDLWGTTITPLNVNTTGFGVGISANLVAQILSVAFSAQVDQVIVTVYSGSGVPLPITLQSFTARSTTEGTVLAWTAASDNITAGSSFDIQRSTDGRTWTTLTTISAQPGATDYTYTDASPITGAGAGSVTGLNISYRLRLTDAGGSITYSPVQTISKQTVSNIRCYPNPFTNTINITSPHPIGQVILKDLQGKVIRAKDLGNRVTSFQWPASDLPPGIYFIQVNGAPFKIVKN